MTNKTPLFHKVLVANRGEIAVRVVRACRDLGISSVAVFSDVDRAALHVRLADEAYAIGPASARESYLRVDKLIDIARRSGCEALHPGYGFLAENPALARACAEAGITFVGPPAAAMEQLGSKTAARQLAYRSDVPMVPGVREPVESLSDAEHIACSIGYPILLKAVAGGGGKGMRQVMSPGALAGAWRDATSEALNAFGDSRVYIEHYLEHGRHIEVQIFGDAQGNILYLGERECSVQRRHQKVIEEAPSSFVTPELRRDMGQAAVRLARTVGYAGAGTVEFLVDAKRNFYFLEVNTRLQVEHPVTEAVTGLDLVALQFAVAAGRALPFSQEQLAARISDASGHAIECRIYAEDPQKDFLPSPGKIASWQAPYGPGIRLDEGVYQGWTVPGDYDPLLGKLIVWGADRPAALARLHRALHEFGVGGIRTNIDLLTHILEDEEFQRGEVHTRWLDEQLDSLLAPVRAKDFSQNIDAAAIAAAVWTQRRTSAQALPGNPPHSPVSDLLWKQEGRRELVSRMPSQARERGKRGAP